MALVKELKQKKAAELAETESKVVADVKLLLASNASEDARIMGQLSENSNFTRIQKKMGDKITLEKFDEEYGEVFHISMIKALCEKYHLRFLGSRHYTGNIDTVVVQKIREFISKHDHIGSDDYSLRNSYFILAPPSMFKLEDKIIVKEKDPVIFYRIDESHYRLIHKWGNDFSVFRRLLGWKWSKAENYLAFWTVIGYIAGAFLANVFTSIEFGRNNVWITPLISVLSAYSFRAIAYSTKLGSNDRLENDYFTSRNWNSLDKLKRG